MSRLFVFCLQHLSTTIDFCPVNFNLSTIFLLQPLPSNFCLYIFLVSYSHLNLYIPDFFFVVDILVLSCYPFYYTCPDDEMKEELENANYQLTVDGLKFTPISGRQRTVLLYIYKAFLKTGVFILDALSSLLFIFTAYYFSHLALWDAEIVGICRVRNRLHPRKMRETSCLSKWTTELIEFFLRRGVSSFIHLKIALF